MLTFYINRAGGNLPACRKRTLNETKDELRARFGRASCGFASRNFTFDDGNIRPFF